MCIDSTLQQIEGIVQFFITIDRNEGFASSIDIAKGLASEMKYNHHLQLNVILLEKKQFDESDYIEEIQTAHKAF